MSAEIESRVRSLENKLNLAAGALAIIAVWAGVTGWISIPNEVKKALDTKGAVSAIEELNNILDIAKKNEKIITNISNDGTIKISGICFKPRTLYRCFSNHGNDNDHVVWFDNLDECKRANYKEESKILVLAQCS